MPGGQRGAALITALLIVALAVTAAAAVASRHQLDIRRTSNLFEGDQAYSYALGVETWAQVILSKDLSESKTDHLKEDWAAKIPPLPVPGGEVSGFIEDLHGRFNLNNLLSKKGEVSEADMQIFERLLDHLDIGPELATAVLDWVDVDIEARFPDGAEDDYYLSLDVPYRAANQPMVSISELRLVKGITGEQFVKLAPHVTVLPEVTRINVNTATLPVLMALTDDMTEPDAQALIDDRGEEGYAKVDDFLAHPALAASGLKGSQFSVASNYFLVHAQAVVGSARSRLYITTNRGDKGEIETILRVRGVE